MKLKGIREIFVKLNIEWMSIVHFLKKNTRLSLNKKPWTIFWFLERPQVYEMFFHLPGKNLKSDGLEK